MSSNTTAASTRALILFGHGSRNPQWAAPMEGMRSWLQAQPQAPQVRLAFLEFIAPSLAEAVAALAAEGVREITIVPIFLAHGGHLQRDLPLMIEQLQDDHPDCRFRLARAAGEADSVIAAIARYALDCAEAAGPAAGG